MEPPHLLTYLSGKQIFGFFSIDLRKALSKKCPESRQWNSQLPFRFDKIVLSIASSFEPCYTANLDSLEWKFENIGTDNALITLPSGEKEKTDDHQAFNGFLKHYVQRENTKVDEMCVKIPQTVMDTPKPLQVFNFFKETHFNKLNVFVHDIWSEEDSEQLRSYKFRTNSFTLEAAIFGDFPTSFDFVIGACELREFCGDDYEVLERCHEFLAGKYSIGSRYTATFHERDEIDVWYWKEFQNRLGAEIKYTSGICGMCVPIDSERKTELFITIEELEFNKWWMRSFRFTATIQKAKLSVSYEEMSVHEKLRYWKHRRRYFVHCKLKKLKKFLAKRLLNSRLMRTPLQIEEDDPWTMENGERVDKWFNWIHRYRMLIPVLLSEVALSILSVRALQISYSPLILLMPLFFILTYLFWPSCEKKDSYLKVMPPRYFREPDPEPRLIEGLF